MQARKAVHALAWGRDFPDLFFIFYDTPGTVGTSEAGKGVGKMDIVEIAREIVANLGFPIFCVVIMFREIEKERESHKMESDAWVEALNRNTIVMEKILTRLEDFDNVS